MISTENITTVTSPYTSGVWTWVSPNHHAPTLIIEGPWKIYTDARLSYVFIGVGANGYPMEVIRHSHPDMVVNKMTCLDADQMPMFLQMVDHVQLFADELRDLFLGWSAV